MRDRDLLPLYRKAGLAHVSLETEAVSRLNLDTFRKQTTDEQNTLAVKLLQQAGIVAEVQFIMGLENETPETIEETYKLAQDWKPDMASWNMYTPWPFAEVFEELSDRVEVRDYSKYNLETPIMKPEAMTRDDARAGAQGRAQELCACLHAQELPGVSVDQGQVPQALHARLPQGVREDNRVQSVL